MTASRIFLVALVALLSGCSTQPVLLNGSTEGVVVRYSQTTATSEDAVAAATQYCAQYGRNAVQGTVNAQTGDTFVSFTCEKR